MRENIYDVVVACGGLGSRLREVTKDTPKPLYSVNGKSTLERCVEQLDSYNLSHCLRITIGTQEEMQSTINSLKKLQ